MFERLRSYVRARTGYMTREHAGLMKNKLSLIYMLAAWNLFGLLVVSIYREKVPKTHDSYDYAKVLGVKDATVIKFSGLTKVAEYDLNFTDEDIEKFHGTIGVKEEKQKYDEQNEERIKLEREKTRAISST